MRILFYAINGLGLGHVTRLLAIARQLKRLDSEAKVIFLTSSEADNVIYQEGFPAIKLPSKNIFRENHIDQDLYRRMVQSVVFNAISSFAPHLMVVDTFPAGNMKELQQLLSWKFKKVFVFREQRPEFAQNRKFQSYLKYYDLVVIPHEECNAQLPVPSGVPVAYTGPILIRSRDELLSRAQAREALGCEPGRLAVYTSFGGGGDPEIAFSLKKVLALLVERPEIDLIFGPGPLYRGRTILPGDPLLQPRGFLSQVKRLFGFGDERRSTWRKMQSRLKIARDWYPAMETFKAFDLAITGVGYNTTHELLHVGVPALYIPFMRVMDDQDARARWIEEAGAGFRVSVPDEDNFSRLLDKLKEPEQRKKVSRKARALVAVNGAELAARRILEL